MAGSDRGSGEGGPRLCLHHIYRLESRQNGEIWIWSGEESLRGRSEGRIRQAREERAAKVRVGLVGSIATGTGEESREVQRAERCERKEDMEGW